MRSLAIALLLCTPAAAETVVVTRTIPARSLILAEDVAILAHTTPGAISDPQEVIGQEARVALYAQRPIAPRDIGPPALVARNGPVTLRYHRQGLTILTEGRALDRAAIGEALRAMNLASRSTVTARLAADGIADVTD